MKDKAIQILIVDDHNMLLEGLQNFVGREFPEANILLASDYKGIIKVITRRDVSVLLLDIFLGKEDSRTFMSKLISLRPALKIVVVSSLEDEQVISAILQNGAMGFVGKSSSTAYIADAIRAVMKGEKYVDPAIEERLVRSKKSSDCPQIILTRREKEVLKETLDGKRIREIADELCISIKTVENHRSNLFAKFNVENSTGLVKKALLLGY